MPPKRVKKTAAVINTNYSDDSDDSDAASRRTPKKSSKNQLRSARPVEPVQSFDDEADDDEDIYDDDNRAYMKMANEVVTKNAKLPALFDPNVLPGFTALINNTSKISSASRVLEASFKVYGKRVDVVHTECKKLDQDVGARQLEEVTQKKKPVQQQEDALNESNSEWNDGGGTADAVANEADFFSEEDEMTVTQKKKKQKEPFAMNVDMTVANFNFDANGTVLNSMAMTSNSDNSFKFNEDNLGAKLMQIAKDRTLLIRKPETEGTDHVKISAKYIEKSLKRANAAAMEFYRKECLKRGISKTSKKETNGEADSTQDYSHFSNSFFQFAMNKKREKRHVCIDDVAAATPDYSRIYMHNEWADEPVEEDDEGDFFYSPDRNPLEDDDILDGVLEHFQGTLELATSGQHKLEEEWVDLFGLEKKDLRPSRDTDCSFEQTANMDFDPDKRLVDRIIIEGEDKMMKAEEERIEKCVVSLFSGRVQLPGGAGNSNENSIRRQINKPPICPMFHDEDIFFPFDLRKYITAESFERQVALSRCYFIKNTDPRRYEIPDKLFQCLKNAESPLTRIPDEVLSVVQTLPDHILIKSLLNEVVSRHISQECASMSEHLTKFRIARYSQQLINSVIHEVLSTDLKPEFFDTRFSRAQSTRPQSSMFFTTPIKKSRFDDTLLTGEQIRYFAAIEHAQKIRYPKQEFIDGTEIFYLVPEIFSRDFENFNKLKQRMNTYGAQAIYLLYECFNFFKQYADKDLTNFPEVMDLAEVFEPSEFEDVASVSFNQQEYDELLDNLVIPTPDAPLPMEIDNDFDNDYLFFDAPTSPQPQPLQQQLSQDLFASDNDGGFDDSNDHLFNEGMEENTGGTLDDSLARIIRRSDIPGESLAVTRPKRNAKKIEFIEDDAHWERPCDGTRKTKKRKSGPLPELQEQVDDTLLFAPRETFANVTTSRRRGNSAASSQLSAMDVSPRIPRCQNFSLPNKCRDQISYRLDDQLGLTIPGLSDPDKVFVSVKCCEPMNAEFQTIACLYRGKYSFLPAFAPRRQEYDFIFWLKVYELCEGLMEDAKTNAGFRKSIQTPNENQVIDIVSDDNDDYFDPMDNDFDPVIPQPPENNALPRRSYAGSLMGEYNYHDEDDDDEEFDDFDFEAKTDKGGVLMQGDGKYCLKRAIKFILTKHQYDRTTLPDSFSGIKAPPVILNELVQTQVISTSTPAQRKKSHVFEFEGDDEMIGGDHVAERSNFNGNQVDGDFMSEEILGGDLLNGMDDEDAEEDENDYENDTDETRMSSFKIKGFHTLKSLLFYLPEVCRADTVKILSVAHVFNTLCHMANENSLNFIQENIVDVDDGEITTDCRILNFDDAERIHAESDLDELMSE